MKIFLTGASGFIASAVIAECKKHNIEVVGVDARPAEGVTVADIRTKEIAEVIPEGVDAVVHLAGLSNDTMCKNNAHATFDLNVLGTINMMEAALARGAKQFIFASTEWVYDNCTAEEQKTEESVINIANHTSEYALSKLVSEANLRQKYQHGFIPTTILRFGIVCGTTGEKKSAVESLFLNVKEKDEVQVGSLKSGRCFIHVSDIASGIVKAIGHPGFEIINLAGDTLITLKDIIEISKKMLGRDPKIVETSPDNVSVRNISNAKAKRLLNWKPETTVEEWIKKLGAL